MLLRLNTGYHQFGSIPGYEYQVGIAVPLHAPEANGLPSPDENAELSEIEDAICGAIAVPAEILFVAVITTGGMREFVFYTKSPQLVQERIEQLRRGITSHEVQMIIQEDKNWGTYAGLC